MTRWGLSATIKAPVGDILAFAAHHLDLGAHRLYIYLDDDNPDAFAPLKAHPKIRVVTCDDAYWRKLTGRRPKKHQVRQTANATHAYDRRAEVDWLIHMDVDEFLWPDSNLSRCLEALSADVFCARVRPMESLSGDDHMYKAFIPNGPDRNTIVARLYPQFGPHVKGGFLSHLAGKLFVRTGMNDLTVKIHNVFRGSEMNPAEVELTTVALCHAHAKSWEDWIAAYRFRLKQGSYRAELAPNIPRDKGGMNMHELLQWIEADAGQAGLRAFHDELCADTPGLRARLQAEGLLRVCDLGLDAKRRKHFADWG
jgi:glycosyl transferase family 2